MRYEAHQLLNNVLPFQCILQQKVWRTLDCLFLGKLTFIRRWTIDCSTVPKLSVIMIKFCDIKSRRAELFSVLAAIILIFNFK